MNIAEQLEALIASSSDYSEMTAMVHDLFFPLLSLTGIVPVPTGTENHVVGLSQQSELVARRHRSHGKCEHDFRHQCH